MASVYPCVCLKITIKKKPQWPDGKCFSQIHVFLRACSFTQVAKKLTRVVMAVTLDHGGLHEGQQLGHPVFVLWQHRKAAPGGSRGRVETTARRRHTLCSASSWLQLELSYAGGWEQARLLGACSWIVCPQGKQCPPNSLDPCCLLHLSPPGLNQRCVSGFVAVTPFCLLWNLVLSNNVQLTLDGGLSLRILVLSGGLLSYGQLCKGGEGPAQAWLQSV